MMDSNHLSCKDSNNIGIEIEVAKLKIKNFYLDFNNFYRNKYELTSEE